MKEVLAVLLAFGLIAGATWLATEQLGDRELMIPPPDAVAEGFVREVIEERYPRAQEYLAREVPEEELEGLGQQIEAAVGEPTEIEAELVSRDDERALVTVRLSSKEGSEALAFALVVGGSGEWRVASGAAGSREPVTGTNSQ